MNKPPTEQTHTTRVPVYDHKLQLIVTTSVEQSAERRGVDGYSALACTLIYRDTICIVLPAGERTLSTLAHEIVHAAFEILKRRDISVTYKSQEVLAYLVGWITNWINKVA